MPYTGGEGGGGTISNPCATIPGGNTQTNAYKTLDNEQSPISIIDDGGYPPPTTVECSTVKSRIMNNIKDSCLKKMVDQSIAKNLDSYTSEIVNSIFGESLDFNLFFEEAALVPTLDGKNDPQGDPGTQGVFNSTITINSLLNTSSVEYIAATIIHEATHAYMTYQGKLGEFNQHTQMGTNLAYTLQHDLQSMFPGMTDKDAKALSWGGLSETQAWKDLVNNNPQEANDILDINKKYKDATGTKGQRCK
ncbi:hypothetical protein [Mucilaginibacter terrae]|uniref:SprT-like domain-containing protein n=1 Tax=Mucilaginibacter terrae TaxID=1955052 RepID=A0ABU3GXK8_9SPHI|nr:hypothetical protein [Mucilaginibacter terrae]MDT3404498.1 hypothetical protein [Mucilaginibacter terrae]